MELETIQHLDHENYVIWSEKVRSILKALKLIDLIDGDDKFLDIYLKTDKGKEEEKIVQSIIISTVNDAIYGEVMKKCKSSKEMWLTLHSLQMDFITSFAWKEIKYTENHHSISNDHTYTDHLRWNEDSYEEDFYLQPPDTQQAQLYQIKRQIKRLQQDVNDCRTRREQVKSKCCFCQSKLHTFEKCPHKRKLKLTTDSQMCSVM